MDKTTLNNRHPLAALICGALLFISACSSGTTDDTAEVIASSDSEESSTTSSEETSTAAADGNAEAPSVDCDETAALFVTGGSANPDLPDPEVAATCDGDTITVVSNSVPDYTYIGTSPGEPGGREVTITIPAEPTVADAVTDIPYIGEAGITLSGIPIYGPTEGTGGDVDSLPGIISACGSHMGPTGFHTHKILTSTETDCMFTAEEVAAEPQLVGYALDGFPIYTGIDQYTSSWELTDESLFASDTWAAHSYVEGSGDLDQCNGLTDADGNYAYYTTEAFPYVIGCFVGEVELTGAGGGGGDDRPEPPADGEDAGRRERPERPADGEGDERPEPSADGEGDERPEPPADGEDA